MKINKLNRKNPGDVNLPGGRLLSSKRIKFYKVVRIDNSFAEVFCGSQGFCCDRRYIPYRIRIKMVASDKRDMYSIFTIKHYYSNSFNIFEKLFIDSFPFSRFLKLLNKIYYFIYYLLLMVVPFLFSMLCLRFSSLYQPNPDGYAMIITK